VHAAVAGIVRAVPHQPDGLAEGLGGLGGLEGGVREQVPAERTAALDDVHLTASDRQPEELRDPVLGDDRELQAAPDLGESAGTSATAQLVSSASRCGS